MLSTKKPTRWSYSSISTYESCPAKWKFGYIDHVPSTPSAAMIRGTRLHSDCENYLNGNMVTLPWELNRVKKQIDELKMIGVKSEKTWQLDKNWLPNDAEPWIKAIIDVHWLESNGNVLHVRDFKSGREYPDHREQLELYALIGLMMFPHTKRAEYGAIYLDTGHVSNEGAVVRGDMLQTKVASWHDRAIRIFEDTQYLPNPGNACKRCDYAKSNNGPCSEG